MPPPTVALTTTRAAPRPISPAGPVTTAACATPPRLRPAALRPTHRHGPGAVGRYYGAGGGTGPYATVNPFRETAEGDDTTAPPWTMKS